MTRYRVVTILTSLTLTFSLLGATPAPRPSCRPLSDLYSQRRLRKMRNLFQMRVYEWKVQQLERAKAAVRHRLSVDDLIKGREASELKQKPALGATSCL